MELANHLLLGHSCHNCDFTLGANRCMSITRSGLKGFPKEGVCDTWASNTWPNNIDEVMEREG